MEGLGAGIGTALIILALCLGPPSCTYIQVKAEQERSICLSPKEEEQ